MNFSTRSSINSQEPIDLSLSKESRKFSAKRGGALSKGVQNKWSSTFSTHAKDTQIINPLKGCGGLFIERADI